MARILDDISRTFSEYLLVPRLTRRNDVPANILIDAPLSRHKKGEQPRCKLNIPFVAASMQAVSGSELSIHMARNGGLAFVFCSQTVEAQAEMIAKVKTHKAGFVQSDSNLKPQDTLEDALKLIKETGHSTIAVTENGTSNGRFIGILTDNDFWEFEDALNEPLSKFMTPKENVILAKTGISLRDANLLLKQYKKECLPIIDENGNLDSLVFKKDYMDHYNNPNEILDPKKRLMVGAGINTHDYKERVPALIEAGVDVLCFDSSDGYTEFQKDAAVWIRKKYGDKIVIGGGNVVSAEAFRYLVEEAKLDFVKVGIGGGSICITREQKGIGRGQASALMDVVAERDRYFEETGIYIPVCSDGGLSNDTQIIIALAMGADFVMMGRYFAMTNESPCPKVSIKGRVYKPYWGEGSERARNWQRYNTAGETSLKFAEGVDGYVPIAGSLKDALSVTISKIKSTMSNMGSRDLKDFTHNAALTRISEQSYIEGGTSTIISIDKNSSNLL